MISDTQVSAAGCSSIADHRSLSRSEWLLPLPIASSKSASPERCCAPPIARVSDPRGNRLCASAGILSRDPRWLCGMGLNLRVLPGKRRRGGRPSNRRRRSHGVPKQRCPRSSPSGRWALGAGLYDSQKAAATRSPAPPPERARAASLSRHSSADQPLLSSCVCARP